MRCQNGTTVWRTRTKVNKTKTVWKMGTKNQKNLFDIKKVSGDNLSKKMKNKTRMTSTGPAVDEIITRLQEVGINFIAIDFDQTIIDIHTGGRWKGTADELIPYVRPVFSELIPAALESNIYVAVVTFSPQVNIVRGVLESIVAGSSCCSSSSSGGNGVIGSGGCCNEIIPTEDDDSSGDKILYIPVRGLDRSWSYRGNGSQEGKQPHMASAVEELETIIQQNQKQRRNSGSGIEITKQTSLLIDDDIKNIQYALVDGVRAVWFNPDKPHHLMRDLSILV